LVRIQCGPYLSAHAMPVAHDPRVFSRSCLHRPFPTTPPIARGKPPQQPEDHPPGLSPREPVLPRYSNRQPAGVLQGTDKAKGSHPDQENAVTPLSVEVAVELPVVSRQFRAGKRVRAGRAAPSTGPQRGPDRLRDEQISQQARLRLAPVPLPVGLSSRITERRFGRMHQDHRQPP
jgi:hypothetical protein